MLASMVYLYLCKNQAGLPVLLSTPPLMFQLPSAITHPCCVYLQLLHSKLSSEACLSREQKPDTPLPEWFDALSLGPDCLSSAELLRRPSRYRYLLGPRLGEAAGDGLPATGSALPRQHSASRRTWV